MMYFVRVTGITAMLAVSGCTAFAQRAAQGIPIDDALTISKCGGCHQRDASGMMGRLSYMRTSPEIWEQAIKRMIRLNGLSASPDEVRKIVSFLSNNNGLAPEEMKPGFFDAEHRTVGYQDDYVPNPAIQKTCNNCHSIGRVLSQRRTREDYEKLVAMHIGLFPSAQNALRPAKAKTTPVEEVASRATTAANGGVTYEAPRAAPAPSAKAPADIAIEYLAAAQPLLTPEWTSWKAAMKTPKLAGAWLLTAYEPGKGKIFGKMTVTPGAEEDQFNTAVEFAYASSGQTVKSTGKSIVYTGYNWRGRSTTGMAPPMLTASAVPSEMKEAMMMSRDGSSMEGRWFWSGFGELGMDVHLARLGGEPMVSGTDLSALQSPSKAQLKIFGGNLGAGLKAADIDLGKGITVTKIVSVTPAMATVEVEVAKGLPVGMRDLAVGKATAVGALAVYDKIAYIQVEPDANISRLGGVKYPKEYSQFEAVAYAAGPDGKAHTDDDVSLGPVSARWGLEEFFSTPEDDDIKYVGAVDDSGLFTPNVEGPNPARKKQANNFGVNNFGDVYVAASYAAPDGQQYKAKAYLVVTVPNYAIYDQPEVTK